jgi:undecaprenyl-diphosphatase
VSTALGIIDAVILGIVEGVTEYLPISSTGHLVLARSLLGLDSPEDVRRNVDALLIVIQGGAILAVLGLYRSAVGRMILGLLGKDRQGLVLLRNIVIAFLPAMVLGPLLDSWIEQRLMHIGPVLLALALGGVIMILADRRFRSDAEHDTDRTGADLSALAALQIGLLQCVAMWPGTSRSMVTILGGMMVGLRPARAAEFSFLLGLPTLGGATVYKLAGNLLGDEPNMFAVLGWMPVTVGIIVATISAALAIRWLVGYLTTHGLAVFGWYRIVLAAVLLALAIGGVVSIAPDEQTGQSADAASSVVDTKALPSDPTRT